MAGKNSVLLSGIHRENPFMKGFLSDVYLRPSCYRCRCKNGVSHSDLTIADYWGINQLMPDFDDDKGVGLVLINTEKGKAVFDTLNMEVRTSSLEDAKRFNGGFKEEVKVNPKRSRFFKGLIQNQNLYKLIERATHMSLCKVAIRKIKNVVKKIYVQFK